MRVPLLAVFGADDPITPVEESNAVFREAVRRELLQVVLAGAGHRLEVGDPPRLVEGYLELLTAFIVGHEAKAIDRGASAGLVTTSGNVAGRRRNRSSDSPSTMSAVSPYADAVSCSSPSCRKTASPAATGSSTPF